MITGKKGAGILLILLMLAVACREKGSKTGEKELGSIPVEVTVVKKRVLTIPIRESGQLAAKDMIKLAFKTGGIIESISVDDGENVVKGEKLAALNLSEIKARVNEASLAWRKAVNDYKRVLNLYRDSVATLEQLEHIRTARDIALNNLQIARFNLKHSVIKAPSDGKILKKLADAGEMIAPGYPVLLFASTEKAWVVRCHVPDVDIVRMNQGDTAHMRFDAWPGRLFTGIVSELGSAADPYTGTYEVEITMDPSELKLVAGLIANVEIYPADTLHAITIPFRALKEADRMKGIVYRMQNGKAKMTEVNIRQMLDSCLIISKGLAPGDTLITNGLEDLLPGMRVHPVKPQQ